MNLSRRFIDYPVMTTLIMTALVIFGVFGYLSLPTSELPSVDFPTIQVSATLAGADPETMASAVAAPLENQFSTIPGIDSMTSSSTQGSTSVTLQFKLERNIDAAAQDVQAAISAAQRQLPPTMITPPTFKKVNPADQPMISIVLYSDTLPMTMVDRYGETLLARQISTLDGVAQVNVLGSAHYAVRVQADPRALAARGIGVDDLASEIKGVNANQATGATNDVNQSEIIHTEGQLDNASAFGNQIIAYRNGAPVRLQDVARVVDSVQNVYLAAWWHNHRVIDLTIMHQPGSNEIQVSKEIQAIMPKFMASLPPGIHLEFVHDHAETILASVENVEETLLAAAALVIGIIFIFLRRVTATIIPSLALPITVIGTFAGMAAFGYSLDNLSLMALTLSVGFVVDDAIVMLENIVRHMEMGEKPYDAAVRGSAEIGFTILSMTVSLAAVFIPIVFMGGIVGRLLHEFAVTIVLAILFSGIVSVTLTPMLCARILRPEQGEKHNRFYRLSEDTFNWVQNAYQRSLQWSLAHQRIILGVFAASILATIALFWVMPEDFLPAGDNGTLEVTVQAANGTSFNRMIGYTQKIRAIENADPNIAGAICQLTSNGAGVNSALVGAILKPYSQRSLSAEQIARELRRKVSNIPGINVFVVNPPSIRIGGRSARSSYQYTLQGLDLEQLQDVSTRLMQAMEDNPAFVGVNSDFDRVAPALDVAIQRDRAAALGVTPGQIEAAMGYAFGGEQVSQIYASSDQYQVILELLPGYQRNAASLRSLYITSNTGTLVPLNAVTTVTQSTIPLSVNHSGELPAITVSFDLAKGYALSDAVTGIDKASRDIGMPATVSGSFQGNAGAFQASTQNMGTLLLIAITVVYIVLGILYESFVHPLTILSGLPSAAVGALLALYIVHLLFLAQILSADMPLTLYAFVGMIMLIGIVKKNAIMMIDFALQRQRGADNVPAEQAIYEAALVRFRPIMMTTMAALMGTLPIVFGAGMGSDSRRPLGVCVAGGLLLSQLLTLYITPVIYINLDRFSTRFGRVEGRSTPAMQAPAE